MYFLFAEDFSSLPPGSSGLERSSAVGSNEEPGLGPTECKLQPKSDQLQGLLALWSASVRQPSGSRQVSGPSGPLGKLLTACPTAPGAQQGQCRRWTASAAHNYKGSPALGRRGGRLVRRAKPLAKAGAGPARLPGLCLHSPPHFVSFGRVERVVCYHCLLCHCCRPGNPVLDGDLLL